MNRTRALRVLALTAAVLLSLVSALHADSDSIARYAEGESVFNQNNQKSAYYGVIRKQEEFSFLQAQLINQELRFCPGVYREYGGVTKCRENVGGLRGLVGMMIDQNDMLLVTHLERSTGHKVDLTNIREGSLAYDVMYSIDLDTTATPSEWVSLDDKPIISAKRFNLGLLAGLLLGGTMVAIIYRSTAPSGSMSTSSKQKNQPKKQLSPQYLVGRDAYFKLTPIKPTVKTVMRCDGCGSKKLTTVACSFCGGL